MTKLDAVRKRLLLKEPASYGKIAIMAGILALIGDVYKRQSMGSPRKNSKTPWRRPKRARMCA